MQRSRAASSRVGGLPRAFWLLFAGTLVNRLGTFVVPFLVLYLTAERGLSVAVAGAMLTLLGAGGLLASWVGGVLADRVGRRATLTGAMLSAAAAMLAFGAARGTWWIALAAVTVGFTSELFRPASQALVADLVAPAERPRAYSLLFWAVNLGWAIATTTGGLLARHGYWLLFVGDALTSLVFGLVVWRGISEPARTLPTRSAAGSGVGTALRDRSFLGFAALQFLFACVLFQIFSTVPLAMQADGLSPAAFGLAVAGNGLLIVAIQPLVMPRLTRLPRSAVMSVAQLALGLGVGSVAFASTLPEYAGTLALATFGEIGVSTVALAMVADFAPVHLRGRYYGAFGLAYGLAAIIAPGAGTFIFARYGGGAVFAGCAGVGVAMGIGQLRLAPAIRQRAAGSLSATAGQRSPIPQAAGG
ncbi:MAG: MFS transporter [Frankiaceae bacterium]